MSGAVSELTAIPAGLVEWWLAEGCLWVDPWEGELGARSMHPEVFFALSGPQPLRWVTRQVVRQPSEARYGRSPVRLVRSTQVRVVQRPAPADLFARFLASLDRRDLGLSGREVRLRPIDWRVRDLGIVGRGWMMLLDGLLVARYLELVEVGGSPIEPAATEITYGVERLALAASSERVLDQLRQSWSPELAVLRRREEEELSRHLLEVTDEGELTRRLEDTLREAELALGGRLAIPAYEAILRGVQYAEVLRARGAFRTLREARAGLRLTELSAACRDTAAAPPRQPDPAAESGIEPGTRPTDV